MAMVPLALLSVEVVSGSQYSELATAEIYPFLHRSTRKRTEMKTKIRQLLQALCSRLTSLVACRLTQD